MTEYDAIARLKQGDIGGLETLVSLHQLKAARTAWMIVRDYSLAEDIVADAFVRAYERISQFDTERPFGPWFLRIVINLAKRSAVRRDRHISLNTSNSDEELALDELLADITPGPQELAEQADLRNAVWTALGKLTPAQRAVIVQRYYLGLSEKEIAANLESPPGTIKWRVHTALDHLHAWLFPLWHPDTQNKPVNEKEMKP